MGVLGLTSFLRDGRNALSTTISLSGKLEQRKHAEADADEQPGAKADGDEAGESRRRLRVVVDAWAFIFTLYHQSCYWTTGGDYRSFDLAIRRVLSAWEVVEIDAWFVFDGPTPKTKHATVLKRLERPLHLSRLFYLTSPPSRSHPSFSRSDLILPPFASSILIDALHSLGYKPSERVFHLSEGEADGYCVGLAREVGGVVVGNDSDFVILGAGAEGEGEGEGYGGFVPVEMMVWMLREETIGGGEGEGVDSTSRQEQGLAVEDGFEVVKKGKKSQKSRQGYYDSTYSTPAYTTTTSNSLLPPIPSSSTSPSTTTHTLTLTLTIFPPSLLSTRLRIPPTHLRLFASLLGTDHSPPQALNLFFEQNSKPGGGKHERVELVARVIRECVGLGSGGVRERLKRLGKVGRGRNVTGGGRWIAPLTFSSGRKTVNSGNGHGNGDNASTLNGNTSGMMTPKSESSFAGSATYFPTHSLPTNAGDELYSFISLVVQTLLLRPLAHEEMLHDLVTCIIEATCHYILPGSPADLPLGLSLGEGEGKRGAMMGCCVTYPFCGCYPVFQVVPDKPEDDPESLHRARLGYARARNAGYLTTLSSYSHPSRSYIRPILEDPEGITMRGLETSLDIRRKAWEVLLEGVRYLSDEEGEEMEGVFDTVDVEDEGMMTPRAEAPVELPADEAMEGVHEEGDTDQSAEPTNAVSSADDEYFFITEYIRSGAPTRLIASDLTLFDSGPPGSPIPLALQPIEDRYNAFLRILEADTARILALPSEWQPFAAIMRLAITLHTGRVATLRARCKPINVKELHRCVTAGVLSYQSWAEDKVDEELVTLESRSCDLIATFTSASQDVLQLAQALLLHGVEVHDRANAQDAQAVHNIRPYRFMEGLIWHRVISAKTPPTVKAETAQLCAQISEAVAEGHESQILGWKVEVSLAKKVEVEAEDAEITTTVSNKKRKKQAKAMAAATRGRFDALAAN